MAKFTAKIDEKSIAAIQRKLQDLANPIGQRDAKAIGLSVVSQMKSLISKGISPMKGSGFRAKFPAYKNPDRYPGRRKSKTPVNLKLSGKFLANLKARAVKVRKGFGVSIGYRAGKQQKKEKEHREGFKGQPKRPTIPSQSGETFAIKVQQVYLKHILRIQRKIAKRKN